MNPNTQRVMFSSESMSWETPGWLFDVLNKEFHFALDVCADKKNKKCKKFIGAAENSLSEDISWAERSNGDSCWMNPPYGRQMIQWVDKAMTEGEHCNVVCLLPARTDTSLFHIYSPYAEVRLIKGRLTFLSNGEEFTTAPFPSMVMVFGPKVKPCIKRWDVDAFRPKKRRN